MSYLVLARKLRPTRFRDLIGQDSICKTLVNAINDDRVAHAFLFTGPRGTGKTSCARILTKALNCQSLANSEPCNQCENCREINLDISTDVLEIDAASNRGIEHIRELREGVKFSPAKCAYKTYIIDEAHMLTTESFNALLKTLEEPPAHVKFILATTDHYKVPPTVISRCQRYDFSNIPTELMTNYLRKVAEDENITISDSALHLISRTSVGGMRDALTILDMLISFSRDEIKDEKVIEILGLNDVREIDDLLKFIINKNANAALSLWRDLLMKGRSITRLVADLMKAVKNLNMVKILPESNIQWHQFLPDQLELYKELSSKVTVSSLQRLFDIILDTESQIKRSSQAKICFEMGLLKMCSLESLAGVAEIVSILREAGGKIAYQRPFATKTPDVGKSLTQNKTQVCRAQNSNQNKLLKQPISKDTNDAKQNHYPKNLTNRENTLEVNEASAEDEKIVNNTAACDHTLKSGKTDSQNIAPEQNTPKRYPMRAETETTKKKFEEQLAPLKPRSKPERKDSSAKQQEQAQTETQPAPPEPKSNLDSKDAATKQKNTKFEQWQAFINHIAKEAGGSLVSLLNNSTVLELNNQKLTIGYGNITIFDEEKRKQINQSAKTFFRPSLEVAYKELGDETEMVTVKDQKEKERNQKIEEQKKAASQNPKIKEILELFPNSQITKIEVLEEQTHV